MTLITKEAALNGLAAYEKQMKSETDRRGVTLWDYVVAYRQISEPGIEVIEDILGLTLHNHLMTEGSPKDYPDLYAMLTRVATNVVSGLLANGILVLSDEYRVEGMVDPLAARREEIEKKFSELAQQHHSHVPGTYL